MPGVLGGELVHGASLYPLRILVALLALAPASFAQDLEPPVLVPDNPRAASTADPLAPRLRPVTNRLDSLLDPDSLDLRLFLGPTVSRANGTATPSMSLGAEVRLHHREVFHAALRAQGNHDLDDESSDPVRVRDWLLVDARAIVQPYRRALNHRSSVSAGLCAWVQARENTPSSEEHSWEVAGGPTLELQAAHHQLRIGAGYYWKALEIDDDLPKQRGKKGFRGEYHVSDGPFLAIDASFELSEFASGILSATCLIDDEGRLREARTRAELELTLWELPVRDSGTSAWQVVLIAYAETRHFEYYATFNRATGFHRDLQAGIFIGLRSAGARRPPRGW